MFTLENALLYMLNFKTRSHVKYVYSTPGKIYTDKIL